MIDVYSDSVHKQTRVRCADVCVCVCLCARNHSMIQREYRTALHNTTRKSGSTKPPHQNDLEII